MNITVYLGANDTTSQTLKDSISQFGKWIAENGHSLVYGGSNSGLMGRLANAVLEHGGFVTGVEPNFFIDMGYVHEGLSKLITTETMAERKNVMIELGDAFIAFPGGTGTLEEISEVMSRIALFQLDAPCILYNLNGYYDDLKALLQKMIDNGFSSQERQADVYFANSLNEIEAILNKETNKKSEGRTICDPKQKLHGQIL